MAIRFLALLSLVGVAVAFDPTCPEPVAPKLLRVWVKEVDEQGDPSRNATTGYFHELFEAIKSATGMDYQLTVHNDLKYHNSDESFGGTIFNCLLTKDCEVAAGMLSYDLNREIEFGILLPLGDYWQTYIIPASGYDPTTVQYVSQDDNELAYLKHNKDQRIKAIWENIQAGRPGSIVADDAAGIAKVASGNFAYLTQTPYAENFAARNSKVKESHVGIVNRFWGMAVESCSPLVELLDRAQQQLRQEGTLLELAKKYGVDRAQMI